MANTSPTTSTRHSSRTTRPTRTANLVYLYANSKEGEYSYIEAAKSKGYSVLLMDGQLDTPMVSMLEQKLEKTRLTRVDSDIIDRLIVKDDKKADALDKESSDILSQTFRSQMPKMEKAEFHVEVEALGEQALPVMMTQSEYMRRMKEVSQYRPVCLSTDRCPTCTTLCSTPTIRSSRTCLNTKTPPAPTPSNP